MPHIPHCAQTLMLAAFLWASSAFAETRSHFECKPMGSGYRPYYVKVNNNGTEIDYSQTPKGLLGQGVMTSLNECQDAKDAANNEFGVICSRTGLNGWKPTLYTGTRPGRADFGYLGGSSITRFDDCLEATRKSSQNGVCFWGGSDWYITPIDREGMAGGPFRTLSACTAKTMP